MAFFSKTHHKITDMIVDQIADQGSKIGMPCVTKIVSVEAENLLQTMIMARYTIIRKTTRHHIRIKMKKIASSLV